VISKRASTEYAKPSPENSVFIELEMVEDVGGGSVDGVDEGEGALDLA